MKSYACLTVVVAVAWSHSASAQPTPPQLTLQPIITSGVSRINWAGAPSGDANRLFILEQAGQIRLATRSGGNWTVAPTPVLNISGIVQSGGNEQGLLGMAFDPNFATNGHVYLNFTANNTGNTAGFGNGTSIVRRYTMSGNTIDPASAANVIVYTQDFSNHNGGWLDFSPRDGFLYVATGDGGSGNDPNNRSQTWNTDLGKLLRIDPTGDDFPADPRRNYRIPASNPWATTGTTDAQRSSFALGLRNPWRNDFDDNGDLFLADVGQGAREEVNYQPGSSRGGENYGWRFREGKIQTPASVGGGRPAGNIDPILDYPRSVGGSITGGIVYRGVELFPLIGGQYFYADYISGRVFSLSSAELSALPRDVQGRLQGFDLSNYNPTLVERTARLGSGNGNGFGIVHFGELGTREMIIVNQSLGDIFLVNATNARIAADTNYDNVVDLFDLFTLQANWSQSGRNINTGDLTGDGSVNLADLDVLSTNWGRAFGVPRLDLDRGPLDAFAASIPEPAAVGVFSLAGAVVLARRPRR